MAQLISVFVAEPNFLYREGIKAMLCQEAQFELAGACESGNQLIEELIANSPRLLIIDQNGESFSLDLVKKVSVLFPALKILSISEMPRKNDLSKAFDAGIDSCLLKECGREEIIEAILATEAGERFLCGRIASKVLEEDVVPVADASVPVSCEGIKISPREVEIIRLVAEGLTNKQIADQLCLSTHTVTTHRKNIMNKLQVNNTAGLVLFAIKNNIVQPNKYLFSTN